MHPVLFKKKEKKTHCIFNRHYRSQNIFSKRTAKRKYTIGTFINSIHLHSYITIYQEKEKKKQDVEAFVYE
jgi:hypothetical protein